VKAPVVIKVGGSLLDRPGFPARLAAFLGSSSEEPALLVVGGGPVADALRTLDSALGIGEKRSHALALRALDLTAGVVTAVVPGLVVIERPEGMAEARAAGLTPVLAPRWFMENVDRHAPDPLPETWETTTDSIAARVARHVGADGLVLLKSTAPGADLTREAAARAGLVDPAFPAASRGLGLVRLVDLRADPCRSVMLI
jgi:aspartokinase-like uncharacterized kinase